MSEHNIDVLIVGAGPVGLFCANEAIRHGLTCRIIDKKETTSDKSKALAIHIRTLSVFDDCGLIDPFLEQGQHITGATFKSNGEKILHVDFSGIKTDRHFLIDLPQDKTETILYTSLQNKGVQVEWNTELTHLTQSETTVSATMKKQNNEIETVNANWLIACDGAHSTVRHQVNGEFRGSAYQQGWWLADLLIDWAVSENEMAVYISKHGPLACFPMGNKRYRLVMTAPKNSTGNPSLQDIEQEFKLRSSDAAVLSEPVWLTQFSIHHRQIQQYRYSRIFFAGDAAHIHSPMGGQGLNTGLQDIYNLVWKLALVEKGKAPVELLNTYHEERFPIGKALLKKTDLTTRLVLLTNPLSVFLRNTLIRCVSSINTIKNNIIKDVAELNISYAKSPIVHQSGSLNNLKAGEFLSDFELTDSTTLKKFKRNDIIQGIQHHLFIFCGKEPEQLSALMNFAYTLGEEYPDILQVHVVLGSNTDNLNPKQIKVWIDADYEVHQYFGIKKPALILVRPDKYVGILQNPINQEELLKQLYVLKI